MERFDYLNRSARPEAATVRSLLEDCLTRFPQIARARLIGAFRSRDRIPHLSAAFELVVHELLFRAGAKTLAVDAAVAKGTAPDFLVELSNGQRLYIEATLATGVTPDAVGAEKRIDDVVNAIDDVTSPDFFWDLSYRGVPAKPVRIALLKSKLQAWAKDLDYDTIVSSPQALPSFSWEEHGLSLQIKPRPRQRSRGNTGPSSIGVVMPQVSWGNSREPIRVRALDKAGKYGELDYPLVVVVNTFAGLAGPSELAEVLFGDIVALVDSRTGSATDGRDTNGIFFDGVNWINPRLDVLAVVSSLTPWTLAHRSFASMVRPDKHPRGIALPFPSSSLNLLGQRLEVAQGITIGAALGMYPCWPNPQAE